MLQHIQNLIKSKSNDILETIIGYRRHIHQYPELSFREFETSKFITEILYNNGIEIDNSFGENAVIGIITGKNPGETIALRADIDALPITETNDKKYISKNIGVMHACGHDAHAASLIGTSIILQNLTEYINGKIILIFQPAEERNPGGAKILIEKGILKKYSIKKIIAQHVTPEVKTGNFCFGSGDLMASTDEIYVKFSGLGGHAALPKKRSDSVLSLIEFINKSNKLQKKLDQKTPTIIAFGKVIAEGSVNVIPSDSNADGTMRTFDENNRTFIKNKLLIIAEKVAKKYKCSFNLEIREGYPSLHNDEELSKNVLDIAKEYLPTQNIETFVPRMTAEDFAFFSRKIQAVLYRTGIEGNGVGNIGLHSSNFDIDENVFSYSVGLMAYIALRINK